MGNYLCQKPMTSMDTFNRKRTVKVSGISQFVRDEITKALQREGNSTGYNDDVNRLHVCPDGQDHVLVEFATDISGAASVVGDKLKINGTDMTVERLKSPSVSSEGCETESVSRIWTSDEPAVTILNKDTNNQGSPPDHKQRSNKAENRRAIKNRRKGRQTDAFNQGRSGLPSYEETPPPFSRTKVRLSEDFAKMKAKKEEEFNEILKDENVKHDKGKLTGTWNAIIAVGGKLVSYFYPSDQDVYENDDENDSLVPPSTPDNQSAADSSTTNFNESTQGSKPDESFTVNSLLLRYIMAYHYEVFQNIENVSKEISFEVKSKSEKDLKAFAHKDVDKDTFFKAANKFIEFYQKKHGDMTQNVIPTTSIIDMNAVSEARKKFSVIIDVPAASDEMTIYGEKGHVEKAVNFLTSKVGGSVSAPVNSPTRTKTEGSKVGGVSIEKLSCELSKNVKLVVYQGDLTKENVDAIVNPANDRLEHGGGAAGAIVKAGGRSIQDESHDIMKRRRYYRFSPGQVTITGSGNLPCKFVVHAVGPIWNDHSPNVAKQLLCDAVYNSLSIAGHYHATSISIPAIGSGLYRVPVDVCAQILYEAVIKFTKDADKSLPLKEIRFVNIDSSTNRTFAREMENRFSSTLKRERAESFLSKDTKQQERQTQKGQGQLDFPRTNSGFTTGSNRGQQPNATYIGNTTNNHWNGQNGGSKGTGNANVGKKPDSNSSKTLLTYAGAAAGKKTGGEDPKPGADIKTKKDDECSICLSEFTKKKTLDKCGHSFCTKCIDQAFKTKKQCPICSYVYGPLTGTQPEGKMIRSYLSTSLPGFKSCGTIVISYRFDSGTQGPDHPNPGKRYYGTHRTAYLPDNKEGQKVFKLLKKAFEQKLTFTIGKSSTTGAEGVITWNDIHHKTSITGGPINFGYPDPDYLKRVQDELAAKGISE